MKDISDIFGGNTPIDNSKNVLGPWQTIDLPQHVALATAETILSLCTGHDDYQRRKIAYYALATWFIGQYECFPGLAIYGPPSTGKTQTLDILKVICGNPVTITAEAISEAALRDSMNQASGGTLVIEEGDTISSKQLEGLLITRFSKSAANSKKMVSDGRDWKLQSFTTFGATVVHRRNLFRDPAMQRRIIPVKTMRAKGSYQLVNTCRPLFKEFKNNVKVFGLPKTKNIWQIEPGVYDCYKPLLDLAAYLEDDNFIAALIEKDIQPAATRLKDEETYLEPHTILKTLVGLVREAVKDKFTLDRINIEARKICPAIREEHGADNSVLILSSNQRNRIIRDDLGFEIRSSASRQRVFLTIPLLIKRCDEYGIKDDLIEDWRKKI